jgi:hypothetical protein
MKVVSIVRDAESILGRVILSPRLQHPRVREKQGQITDYDVYYRMLLEAGHLPGEVATFPNRALTAELHRDIVVRVPDLRFTSCKHLGGVFRAGMVCEAWGSAVAA